MDSLRRDTSSTGQALEFRVWSALVEGSEGRLHTFLPLLDPGLDAILHRRPDGAYLPVQVKGREPGANGVVELILAAGTLIDDAATLIAARLEDGAQAGDLLVVDVATFKRLATPAVVGGTAVFEATFGLHPRAGNRWQAHFLSLDQVAGRLLGALAAAPPPPLLPPDQRHNSRLGFLGESEIIRRLAESPRLDLFRPFPDLELVEILARNNLSHGFAGLQSKAVTYEAERGEVHVDVRKATLVPAPSTYVVVQAWLPAEGRFHDEILYIPAALIPEVGTDEGDQYLLWYTPASRKPGRLDQFRHPRAALPDLVEATATQPPTPC